MIMLMTMIFLGTCKTLFNWKCMWVICLLIIWQEYNGISNLIKIGKLLPNKSFFKTPIILLVYNYIEA
jgi:hypothetical protein